MSDGESGDGVAGRMFALLQRVQIRTPLDISHDQLTIDHRLRGQHILESQHLRILRCQRAERSSPELDLEPVHAGQGPDAIPGNLEGVIA